MGVKKHIKCVNFDLSTEKLLKHFPNGTAKPYDLIKQFFLDKGFEHRQYSGYISKEPLGEYQTDKIIKELGKKFTWLKDCMQEFDVSNAPEKVSVKEQIIYSATKEEHKRNIQRKHADLAKEIKYYTEHKNSFYSDARKRSEDKIISLCVELNTNGEIISSKDLEVFLNIVKERNSGRSL